LIWGERMSGGAEYLDRVRNVRRCLLGSCYH
jgi:hypothetical protein